MPNLHVPESRGESSRSRSRQRAKTEAHEHRSVWDRLSLQTSKLGSWLRREEEEPPPGKQDKQHDEENKENGRPHSSHEHGRHGAHGFLNRRGSRKVVPGLPRPLTFKRQNSERREKLLPVPVSPEQRRAASADRRASTNAKGRALSPPAVSVPSLSAPDVLSPHNSSPHHRPRTIGGAPGSNIPAGARQVDYENEMDEDLLASIEGVEFPPEIPDTELSLRNDIIGGDGVVDFSERGSRGSSASADVDEILLQQELDLKWILNLSMHFRDNSDREKFFITYAEEPNKWRRVTISCDYRELQPESLEADLRSLHYQRDKSARIYEAIRDSLHDIQFYETVTNLKLQTAEGRLHVHVTEDVNEIIPYPSVSAVEHLDCPKFKERDISFDQHISGYVYKVNVHDTTYIKKEIPGPDAVEEFLYEINALFQLQDAKSVIKFEGIIVDERSELIKGLLISYASQGALVDIVYENRHNLLWQRREKWARQIVEGLSEIHEAGFVQGDFTLSNIVIDADDNAKIIDINRRGCPVGWEPPELARLIESGQRISIYIGVKSDLFQLGMVLWAIAEQEDEPERQERPLANVLHANDSPAYFREIITECLSELPSVRPGAKDILTRFPPIQDVPERAEGIQPVYQLGQTNADASDMVTPEASYFLPAHPPRRNSRGRSPSARSHRSGRSVRSLIIDPRSSNGSLPHGGRQSILSLDSEIDNELASLPASRETRWEQVYVDGDAKYVTRAGHGQGLDIDGLSALEAMNEKDVILTTQEEHDTALPVVPEGQILDAETLPHPNTELEDATRHELGHTRGVGAKASFSDRIHAMEQHGDLSNSLAGLESLAESTPAPTRTATGFSVAEDYHKPLHQDSGFAEGTLDARASWESERIRQSLDEVRQKVDGIVTERLWDGGDLIKEERRLEERGSAGTIRPMSIQIPTFSHKAVGEEQ
ncbi:hypothetical protein BDV96DRAFT_601377 [Lophiotrema nucula]|uniref:Protein kinase domain-containing protein n=1 Tax=Lophiotrema nucula TaxID=690887 RepID=A0A6A5Z2A4_9PLEO|nr:hypothetical protein BDV96DRAFT_601377 [Lophiotrema nucula]